VPGLRGIGAIPNHPIQASYRAILSASEPSRTGKIFAARWLCPLPGTVVYF
jgi:hypothetical protein